MDAPPAPPLPQQLPLTAQWCVKPQLCIALEVARSPDEQRRGLMQRPALPPLRGMWFPFETPRPLRFWMLNTLAPLDMIFVLGRAPWWRFSPGCRCAQGCPAPAMARVSWRTGWWNWRLARRIALASKAGDAVRYWHDSVADFASDIVTISCQSRSGLGSLASEPCAVAEGLAAPGLELTDADASWGPASRMRRTSRRLSRVASGTTTTPFGF